MKKSALATVQPIADTDLPEKPEAERTPDYSRLSYAEIALALKLTEDGLNQTQVAQRLECSPSAISRLLSEFHDTRPLAKLKAHNRALKLVDRVLEQADVEESLEVLDRIGVLEKRHPEATRSQVAIAVVNMPGQQAITADMIDVSPRPFAPPCMESGHGK